MFAQGIIWLIIIGLTTWGLYSIFGKKLLKFFYTEEYKTEKIEKRVKLLKDKVSELNNLKDQLENMKTEKKVIDQTKNIQQQINDMNIEIQNLENNLTKQSGFAFIDLAIIMFILSIICISVCKNIKINDTKERAKEAIEVVGDIISEMKVESQAKCIDGKTYIILNGKDIPIGEDDRWGALKYVSCE